MLEDGRERGLLKTGVDPVVSLERRDGRELLDVLLLGKRRRVTRLPFRVPPPPEGERQRGHFYVVRDKVVGKRNHMTCQRWSTSYTTRPVRARRSCIGGRNPGVVSTFDAAPCGLARSRR